jgi:hypothetical protein
MSVHGRNVSGGALRIYCETLPLEDVVRPRTIALLERYALEIVLAVRPWDVDGLPRVARALSEGGVTLSVWPMLSDEDGRWASAHNAEAFASLVERIIDALAARELVPRDVLLDLEPPFKQARALTPDPGATGLFRLARGVARPVSPARMSEAEARLGRVISDLRAKSITTSLAVWPPVALDPPGERGWQTLLGTPIDGLAADHVSVMLYTSILEGWSRGALRRRDVMALLARGTERVVRRFGERAGVSLGCVGTGAFEHEPIYRTPAELAADVAIARSMGCTRLALFDLGGVLAREPAEAWLDAFTKASDADLAPPIHFGKRVTAARTLARAATWALGRRRRAQPR